MTGFTTHHEVVKALGPFETPSPEFANLATGKAMNCFGCSQPVGTTPKQLHSGHWVADCATCGLTNKLLQDADHPQRFSVVGALIPVRRDGQS
jgi:hypothetical protein